MSTAALTESRPFGPVSTWIRLILGFLVVALPAIPALFASLLVLPWRGLRIRVGNLYGKFVGGIIARMAGARMSFENRERITSNPPGIYVSNHASTLDIFLGILLCPMGGCGVGKKELVKVPFFGWLFKLSGHLLIDRTDRESAIASLAETAQEVKRHGMSIWMWPEGTRSRNGRLQQFKKGFAHLAIATGLPITPVVVHGAHKIWPNKTKKLFPGDLRIQVLQPIDTSAWTVENLNEHIREVHEAFLAALAEDQQPANE